MVNPDQGAGGLQYDFYSPFMSAAIVTPDGARIPFWTNIGGTEPIYGELDKGGIRSLAYVTDISVTLNLGQLPTIEVSLAPPFREAMKLIDSSLVEWGRSAIQVQFGYSGGAPKGAVLSPVYSGLMMQPDVSIGEDVSIRLKAQGAFSLASDSRNFSMNDTTRLDLIEKALKGADPQAPRNLRLDSSLAMADGVSGPLLIERLATFSAGHKTDWDLIYLLCNECQCWPQFLDDTLVLLPRGQRLSDAPKRIFSLFEFPEGKIGPVAGVFPILSVQTPSTAIYYPGVVKGLTQGGILSANRTPVHNFYDDTAVRPVRVGPGGGVPKADPRTPGVANADAKGTSKDGAEHLYGDVNDSRAAAKAKAEYTKITSGLGLRLEIDSLGVPDLVPGDVIAVRGCGVRLNGNYGVFEVTHSIGAGGYNSKFVAWSNVSKMSEQYSATLERDPNIQSAKIDSGMLEAVAIPDGLV